MATRPSGRRTALAYETKNATVGLDPVEQICCAQVGSGGIAWSRRGRHMVWMNTHPYPSDLSDEEWAILGPLITPGKQAGHPQLFGLRRIVEAVFYLLRTGCQWRAMPHEYPPWPRVFYHFAKWRRQGTWERINTALRERHRVLKGRKPQPTAAIIDSQSVRTTEAGALRQLSTGCAGGTFAASARAATTAPRRSPAASGTSSWTPKAICSRPACTRPTSTTGAAPSCCSQASRRSSRALRCSGPTARIRA